MQKTPPVCVEMTRWNQDSERVAAEALLFSPSWTRAQRKTPLSRHLSSPLHSTAHSTAHTRHGGTHTSSPRSHINHSPEVNARSVSSSARLS